MRSTFPYILALVTLSCACATTKQETAPRSTDPVLTSIQNAVSEMRDFRKLHAEILREQKPMPSKNISVPQLPEFQTTMHIRNWNGGVQKALDLIAQTMGYSFSVDGKKTPEPIVHLNGDKPVGEFLVEIADQGENLYDIRVSTQSKQIKLVYRP